MQIGFNGDLIQPWANAAISGGYKLYVWLQSRSYRHVTLLLLQFYSSEEPPTPTNKGIKYASID